MFGDAHSTNWAENYQFFLNQNNPDQLRARLEPGLLPLPPDRHDQAPHGALRPGDGLLHHQEAGRRRRSTPRRRTSTPCNSRPRPRRRDPGRVEEILTNTVVIHFFPNSWDLYKKITEEIDGQDGRGAVRPQRRQRAGGDRQTGGQVRHWRGSIIEGHTDSSMKGRARRIAGQGTVPRTGPTR